jgi:hypothetical protein
LTESREDWEARHPRWQPQKDPLVDGVLNRISKYGARVRRFYDDKEARQAMQKVQQLAGDISIRIITTEFDAALALIVSMRDKLDDAESALQNLAQEKFYQEEHEQDTDSQGAEP